MNEKIIQLIGITPNALVDLIDDKVRRQLEELKDKFEPKTPTEYLTRQDVSTLLSVDISTVHNYTKKKILQSYQIGGRVYYKRDEVEKAIVKLK